MERENRDWLMKLLMVTGFSVQGVDNGEKAVRAWEEWNPPVMDGIDGQRYE